MESMPHQQQRNLRLGPIISLKPNSIANLEPNANFIASLRSSPSPSSSPNVRIRPNRDNSGYLRRGQLAPLTLL
jgi:hypothetical protein